MGGPITTGAPQLRVNRRPYIVKPPRPWPVEPNLGDYAAERASFSWESARRALDGLPGGRGLNIGHEAVDRHAAGSGGSVVALQWLARDGQRRNITYDDLRRDTNRFANVLRRLGVGKGDVVATVMGRTPALYTAALGTLKNASVCTRPRGSRSTSTRATCSGARRTLAG
jgi:acetyl-CoA synthetase